MAAKRHRVYETYTDGNTVRKVKQAGKGQSGSREAAQRKKQAEDHLRRSHIVRRNREKALQMDAPYVMALTLAAIITLAICMQYLALRSSITSRLGNIEKLEREVEALRAENDALETSINTYVDLDYIYDVATKELGMVYANKDQILLYDKTESEYVRQYEDIPEH